MNPAVNQVLFHAEMVTRGQCFVACGAGEAAQMVHGVPGAHHHFRGGDAEVAAGTSLHGEPSGTAQVIYNQTNHLDNLN